ncbi:MAG: inorganic pyrophosphatase [Omnitrophica WOR_2 bacterium]
MNKSPEFWNYLDRLVDANEIVIDRPQGTPHPRYQEFIYPVDYGYLKNTTTIDGGGIDIWKGSLDIHRVTGILCTVDLTKRDAEIKILLSCTQQEVGRIREALNQGSMRCIFISRPD